ncbi:MAG: ABC-ATPase domain-containing protein [Clostridia bacterium]|nr:ABC-ATPase domain-containing protein [Clostridia bacterium]
MPPSAGKSGIYNHIPGDGKEYVIADESLLPANAGEGRFVGTGDISLFFKSIPFRDVRHFSADHACGSVSQAANVCEAIYAGSRLLTIDEDKSAANFMIRDEIMRRIVKNEIIIPF